MTTPQENLPIRMLRPSRYGAVGDTNTTLDWGVRATLVERRVAEWVIPEEREHEHPRKQKNDSFRKRN